jgi:hypothetical protein
MAPATTSVPRVIASVTGLVTAVPTFTFSVCRVLCTALRFEALFALLPLRDALARFEAVFVARDAVFAAVRPRALPPPALARDLDAVVFAGALLRVAAVLETVFLEAAVVSFLGAADFFRCGSPPGFDPAPGFGGGCLRGSSHTQLLFERDWDLPAPAARQQSNRKRGKGASFLGRLGTTSRRSRN